MRLLLVTACAMTFATATSAAPFCERTEFRVVVDVGHTAESRGAISARGVPEYEYNLRLATQIEQALLDVGFGHTTLLVTEGKALPSLFKRVNDSRALAPDLLLSVHHDSVPEKFLKTWEFEGVERPYSDDFRGHSLFVSRDNGDYRGSLRFARLIGLHMKERGLQYTPHYAEAFMSKRRRQLVDAEAGVYRYDQFIVLRQTRMPAVLLEAGSIINRDEELEAGSSERRAAVTTAVVAAVEDYCTSVAEAEARRHPPKRVKAAARKPAKPGKVEHAAAPLPVPSYQ